jgi:hypothetical protein
MNWKALRDELAASSYLDPEDDLTTQRGIVATALAIVERMSGELREVSWRPVRLLEKTAAKPLSLDDRKGADKPGNAPVRSTPMPRKPAPGGIAVQPIDAFAIEG